MDELDLAGDGLDDITVLAPNNLDSKYVVGIADAILKKNMSK